MGDTSYSKNRRSITEPVLKVPDNLVKAPLLDKETREDVAKVATETVKKLDKDRLVVPKRTGWLISSLVITLLGASAYLGASFVKRGHQVNHLQDQVRILDRQIEDLTKAQQATERRFVELETKLELMQEPEIAIED